MGEDISSSEIEEKINPGIFIPFLEGIGKKDFVDNLEASKEFSKTYFQSTIVRFVLIVAALSLGWLVFVYMVATLNVPQAGKIFIIDKDERLIIIGAIATNSLGFAFAVIRSLFPASISHEKEGKIINPQTSDNILKL
jgi:hypothetical protein